MICERAIGQADETDPVIDWIDLDWPQTLRRALRLTSRAGRRVSVILRPGDRLRHRDVLSRQDDVTIAVSVRAIDVLIVRPVSMEQASRVAFELGNQHTPAEVLGDAILTPDDGPTREIIERLGVPFTVGTHRLQPMPIILPTPTI